MTIRTLLGGEGTNKPLVSRFAAVQVRVARGKQKREPAWLVIECPQGDDAPAKYCLSNLPEDTSLATLVAIAKGRWRIERDYQALKQELGLNHYEGRNWRGHHRATLCTVAYGFLFMERLRCGGSKNQAMPSSYYTRRLLAAGPCNAHNATWVTPALPYAGAISGHHEGAV